MQRPAPSLELDSTIISKLSQSPTISPARISRVSFILEPRNPRTSELLAAIASAEGEERIYFGDLTAAMRNRAFGILFLLFGIPICLPIPGLATVCGFIITLIAAQMILGRDNLWLPQFLARRSFARKDLQRLVTRAEPWIQWVERFATPRLALFADARSRRIIGIVGFVLGLALLPAIPVIGAIPLGIPICILGLGLVERDGAVILAGYVATSLGLLITAGLGYLIFQGALVIF